MSGVELANVVMRYGSFLALDNLNLSIREGEFLSLSGPSGCGKTTALRLIAGFLTPSEGQILMDGEDLAGVPPERRNIGMVFQDYALFPHFTVAENIAFGLRERRQPAGQIKRRVGEMLELVQLQQFGDRYPAALSGGQQQRVAMARALAISPRVLLMDEPLGALDLKLREAMQDELHRLQRDLGITTIYVTHDQGEAIRMSHRIAVMNAGRLMQLGTPKEIYNQPQNKFVAQFVGRVNFLSATASETRGEQTEVVVAGQKFHVSGMPPVDCAGRLTLALRPESLRLQSKSQTDTAVTALPGRIVKRIFAGSRLDVYVRLINGETLIVEESPSAQVSGGEEVWVTLDTAAITVLKEE